MGHILFEVCLLFGLFVICFSFDLSDEDDSRSESREAQDKVPKCQTCRLPILRPVCGSDGKTYSSFCDLQRAACIMKSKLRRTNLQFFRWGKCSFVATSVKAMDNDKGVRTTPTPGSKQVTTEPTTHTFSRHTPFTHTPSTHTPSTHTPSTHPPPTTHTPTSPMTTRKKVCYVCYPVLVARPVCGSDGHTYDSMCQLLRVACLTERTTGRRGPSYINSGRCAPTTPKTS
eukprot:XP_011663443.1 PREDICTED: agrin-like [Strongylocentrotus purpuratus]